MKKMIINGHISLKKIKKYIFNRDFLSKSSNAHDFFCQELTDRNKHPKTFFFINLRVYKVTRCFTIINVNQTFDNN